MRFIWTRSKEEAASHTQGSLKGVYTIDDVKHIYAIFKDINYDKVPIPPEYDKKYRLTYSYLKVGGGQSYMRVPFPYPPEAPYAHLPSDTFRFHFSGSEDLATIHDKTEADSIINVLKIMASQIHPRFKEETSTGEEEYYCATINPEANDPNKPFFLIVDFKYYEEDRWWEKYEDGVIFS